LRESRLFLGFTAKEYEHAISVMAPERLDFEHDDIVQSENTVLTGFFYVLSGEVIEVQLGFFEDPKKLELINTYSAGDFIGIAVAYSNSRISPVAFKSVGDTSLIWISKRAVESEEIEPHISKKLYENLMMIAADESIKMMYRISILQNSKLYDKVLVFLFIMRRKFGKAHFSLKMDREQMAWYLGVNRSALSAQLSELQKAGIINFAKSTFTINVDKVPTKRVGRSHVEK
jgi:CRP-like cAMP-binding protein